MKLTDEEVEECFQGAYGHGTAAYEAAKNAKEAMLAEKKEAEMAKQGTDWAQRKACLEAEIRDFREELESRQKGQIQADIAGTDLEQE